MQGEEERAYNLCKTLCSTQASWASTNDENIELAADKYC